MPKSRGICDQHDSNILGKSLRSETNIMIFGDLGGGGSSSLMKFLRNIPHRSSEYKVPQKCENLCSTTLAQTQISRGGSSSSPN